MTALVSYSTGTVSVAADGTIVTGVGPLWLTSANAKPGDIFQSGHFFTFITDVTDETTLVVPPWPGSTLSGATYNIWKISQQRIVGAEASEDMDKVLTALNTTGWFIFVPPAATAPDPSLGNDGQYAMQPTTGKQWVKVSGVWTYQGIYRAFRFLGAWSGATAYTVGDVVALSGASYVCVLDHTNHTPPNATYWQLLASAGSAGPASWSLPSAWATATAYAAIAPSSVVVQNGSTYVCLVPHTSGTFATDLAAGKWILVAQAAPIYNVTSNASLAIAIASKAFTGVATNNAYQIGDYVRAKSNANAANYMEGNVTANAAGTLTVNVTRVGGSGTFADWNISPTGAPGVGDMLKTDNLSGLANVGTAANNLGVISYVAAQTITDANKRQVLQNTGLNAALRGYISGLYFSTPGSSVTMTVSPGVATDDTSSDIMLLASSFNKFAAGPWGAGHNNSGLDTGSIANNTTYHFFLIKNPTSGAVDVVFSLSPTAPTMPSGFTLKRWLFAMKTDGTGQWRGFSHYGDKVLWTVPTLDDLSAVGTTAALVGLNVPTGIKFETEIYGLGVNGSAGTVWMISSPDQADVLPSTSGPFSGIVGFAGNNTYSQIVRTNTSGQVRKRASAAGTTIYINTFGWRINRDV